MIVLTEEIGPESSPLPTLDQARNPVPRRLEPGSLRHRRVGGGDGDYSPLLGECSVPSQGSVQIRSQKSAQWYFGSVNSQRSAVHPRVECSLTVPTRDKEVVAVGSRRSDSALKGLLAATSQRSACHQLTE